MACGNDRRHLINPRWANHLLNDEGLCKSCFLLPDLHALAYYPEPPLRVTPLSDVYCCLEREDFEDMRLVGEGRLTSGGKCLRCRQYVSHHSDRAPDLPVTSTSTNLSTETRIRLIKSCLTLHPSGNW